MSIKSAKAILWKNGIEFREVGGWLQVKSVFCVFGQAHSVWVPCPDTYKELNSWLGN